MQEEGATPPASWLELEAEIRFKQIREIDSERFPLFRGRKCSFRGIMRSTEESIPTKKFVLQNSQKT